MVDTTKIAIADVLKHPDHGLISFQPAITDLVEDKIFVRDINGSLFQVLASECEETTCEETRKFWKKFPLP